MRSGHMPPGEPPSFLRVGNLPLLCAWQPAKLFTCRPRIARLWEFLASDSVGGAHLPIRSRSKTTPVLGGQALAHRSQGMGRSGISACHARPKDMHLQKQRLPTTLTFKFVIAHRAMASRRHICSAWVIPEPAGPFAEKFIGRRCRAVVSATTAG